MSELKKFLNEVFENDDDDLCTEFMHGEGEAYPEKFPDVVIKSLDSYGGEDQGSDYWHVYSFTKDGETLNMRFNGQYASHYGTDYLGFEFVVATPVQRIEWVRSKK